MTLEIVIVSFNTKAILRDCLRSLFESLDYDGLTHSVLVTVVDNDSHDGTVQMLKKDFRRVNLILNNFNAGFAKANNQAIRKSEAPFILLLNSDTIVKKGSIAGMLGYIRSNVDVSVVGPKLLNSDGSLQQSFGFAPVLSKVFFWMLFIDDLPILSRIIRAYHVTDPFWYSETRQVGWVTGAAILFRREIAEKAGLMDEKIFMYGEEVEWCYRINIAGGKVVYLPDSEIIHLGGGSMVVPGANITREYKSVVYFYQKYYPGRLFAVRLFLKLGALLRLVLFGIIGKSPQRLALYAEAYKVA